MFLSNLYWKWKFYLNDWFYSVKHKRIYFEVCYNCLSPYNESHQTYWLSLYGIFFSSKISLVFHRIKKCIHVWNSMWENFLVDFFFLVNCLLKAEICNFCTTGITKHTVIAKILFLQHSLHLLLVGQTEVLSPNLVKLMLIYQAGWNLCWLCHSSTLFTLFQWNHLTVSLSLYIKLGLEKVLSIKSLQSQMQHPL